jgi:Cu/Ag efflux pump CusA
MAVDALLVITLAPVLISFFMKGKFQDDKKNPVNRGIEQVYEPVIRWCIKWRKTVIGINIAALLISIPLVMNLGKFMPPLDEGSLFLCPSLFPMYPILKRKEFCRCRIKSSNLFLKYSTCLAKRVEQILQQIIRQ